MSGDGDAAYILEKALEEMDDIFRDTRLNDDEEAHSKPQSITMTSVSTVNNRHHRNHTDQQRPTTTTSSLTINHRQQHSDRSKHVDKVKQLLNELEVCLSNQSRNIHHRQDEEEEEEVRTFCRTLEQVPLLFQHLHPNNNNNGNVNKNAVADELNGKVLQLEEEKKVLGGEVASLKRRVEELSCTQQQQQQQQHKSEDAAVQDSSEMDRLKLHIDTLLVEQEKKVQGNAGGGAEDSLSGLRTRLRDKASECNRLKLQLEDSKQTSEAKDVTIRTIQDQIQRLFEENELLRKQLVSATNVNNNLHANIFSTSPHHVAKCNGPPSESASSSGAVPNRYKTSNDFAQMKSLKCASEPNLIQNGGGGLRSGPSILSPSSFQDDDAVYRPYRRVISDAPFGTWTADQVQDWLRDEGLEEYADACGRCIKKGEGLLKLNNAEYEQQLGIYDPVIRKKLRLALQAQSSNVECDYAGRLDNTWVIHWLEDLGLPQYKQSFYEHKLDGRVLVNMTLDEVLQCKVYNLLHHTSLKRAIQFLRHQRFHPQYLREIANQSEERCDHVMLWTNSRIMHWLRSVDLAEYAPNLRGSGVHGALMVLEPRFNADTLANLLSIPNNKTLLRKHVSTQFATLLGDACQKQKEITQKTADFQALNGSEKHKLRKKGFTHSLRRRKSEVDLTELLCPSELDVSNLYSPPPALDPDVIFDPPDSSSLSPSLIADNVSESTNDLNGSVPKITGLSQEIDHMTSMLERHTDHAQATPS